MTIGHDGPAMSNRQMIRVIHRMDLAERVIIEVRRYHGGINHDPGCPICEALIRYEGSTK